MFRIICSAAFLVGCTALSPAPVPDVAPAGLAASVLELRYAGGTVCRLHFRQGNRIVFNEIPAAYGRTAEYRKIGPASAVVAVEEWESMGTYRLDFESAASGTAVYSGVIEGMDEAFEGIQFRILPED